MTKEEIGKIQINDILMNIKTRDIIVIKGIEEGYFNCSWDAVDTVGRGSIPEKHLESPVWYSLMKERYQHD